MGNEQIREDEHGEAAQGKRMGIDRRNQSEERYGDLENESVLHGRHGERELEYQERNAGAQRPENASEVRDHEGYRFGGGSATQGAFGGQGKVRAAQEPADSTEPLRDSVTSDMGGQAQARGHSQKGKT